MIRCIIYEPTFPDINSKDIKDDKDMINENKSISTNHLQTRRTFLQVLSASAFAGVISSAPLAFAGDVKRPNIVILYADDM